MKGAIRHLALDGAGSQAIVVCADIAEYARGSSGEPTQGAGAVAMLLEEDPKLAVVDLVGSGSASDYRVMDFRKPMSALLRPGPLASRIRCRTSRSSTASTRRPATSTRRCTR